MKILALEVEGASAEQFKPYLEAEARRAWDLYQSGVIREIFFRADRSEAILIRFDIIPLVPYPGFARLFKTCVRLVPYLIFGLT